MSDSNGRIPDLLKKNEVQLLTEWIAEQTTALSGHSDLISDSTLKTQCMEFMGLLRSAVRSGKLTDIQTPEWEPVREMLTTVSRSRALQGFSPSQTATFVLSLKKPLFARLQQELRKDPNTLADD